MWAVINLGIVVLLTTDEKRARDTAHAIAIKIGVTNQQGPSYYMTPAKIGDMPVVFVQEIEPERFRYEGEIAVPDLD